MWKDSSYVQVQKEFPTLTGDLSNLTTVLVIAASIELGEIRALV